ncbi:hypothetical protein [Arsenicicoccus cauae]|uniref:hypothetical protein n=1 Tax=Arsenicicoccus cauae TaxID=2663847 RepID=UPI001E64FD9F|nr:hypothetical protein [Arsenicicoccus cauae]
MPVPEHAARPAWGQIEQARSDGAVLVAGQVDHPGEHLKAAYALVDVMPHMLIVTQPRDPTKRAGSRSSAASLAWIARHIVIQFAPS